jgi:hypothetical protein
MLLLLLLLLLLSAINYDHGVGWGGVGGGG